jgi:hypothetical protein
MKFLTGSQKDFDNFTFGVGLFTFLMAVIAIITCAIMA